MFITTLIIYVLRYKNKCPCSYKSQWPRGLRRGVCGRSLAGTAVSNPAGSMDVCLLWVLCVVR